MANGFWFGITGTHGDWIRLLVEPKQKRRYMGAYGGKRGKMTDKEADWQAEVVIHKREGPGEPASGESNSAG